MNIVKVKDIAVQDLPEDVNPLIFATFKDKYCYCINWQWLVNFEDITEEEYVRYSNENADMSVIDPNAVRYEFYLDNNLIDLGETMKINSIAKFIEYNKFSSSDSDLTIDDVKRFRTWLAETLYNILAEEESQDVLEMLNYYRLEMNDDTIKHLTLFPVKATTDVITATNRSTCGCQGTTGITTLLSGWSVCDPVALYRKAVYDKMVEIFSNVYFWTARETELLQEIKKYIDFIIAKNLPLVSSQYVSDLYDCGCLSDANSSQERLMSILKDLSRSLQYMIDEDLKDHKNFVGDTLNKWASYLYEKMRWY